MAEPRKAMEFFGDTTYSPGGPFRVCFGGVHVRLAADACRPALTAGFLSLARRAAPAMAVAVAALFCLHFSAPAYGFGLRAAGPRGPAAWQAGAEEAHESGRASWYGTPEDGFAYRTTACGETMDPDAWTCAHRSLPFGTIVLVENLLNGRTAMLRVNDRGPYVGGRIIDLSRRGADELGILRLGVVPVRIRPVGGVLKGHVTRAARAWRGSPPGAPFAAGGASARGLWPAPARRPADVRPRAAADFRRAPSAPRDGGARAGGPGAGA